MIKEDHSLRQAKAVLKIEADSILGLIKKLDRNFSKAVDVISKSKGRVIVTGIGKSGLIGRKIVATLTSTGTPAIFLHPVEGMHGDLGIVTRKDVIIAISNSGETEELNTIIRCVRDIGAPLITLTGNPVSSLGKVSDIVIDVGVEREACPFGLAPTSSSTAALAMGDALAVALIKKKNFSQDEFYKFHPGGSLGWRLLARVKDAMIHGPQIPRVVSGSSFQDAVDEMDKKNKGFVLITDRENRLTGILTDGDIRRLVRRKVETKNKKIDAVMTPAPKTISENKNLAETIEAMQRMEITTLAVVDDQNRLRGYIHLHDILGRGGTLKISTSS